MFNIPVIIGSTRRDRQSIKAGKFVHSELSKNKDVTTELVDLLELDLPIMEERLRFRNDAPNQVTQFSRMIQKADALVIVSPEYNNGYPGVLKNALDYLLPEYERKPFGFVTVSAGSFGGLNCLAQLRLICLGMGGFPIPESLTIAKVQNLFDEQGLPTEPLLYSRTKDFLDEVLWFTEAVVNQKNKKKQRAA
jgi:NAD(P)H-dependent FMN reductase